jgi:hypothetical protein
MHVLQKRCHADPQTGFIESTTSLLVILVLLLLLLLLLPLLRLLLLLVLLLALIILLKTLYPHKLAPTSPTSGGRSVCIVRLRTKATE